MRILSGTPSFTRTCAAVIAGAFALTCIASTAQAQTPPAAGQPAAEPTTAPAKEPDKKTRDAARKAYNDAKKAFDKGDFAAATAGFKKADETLPSPHAKYWYAVALDKSDPNDEKLSEKIAAYQAYVKDPEAAKVGEPQLAEAQKRHEELVAKTMGVLKLATVPPDAKILVDGQEQANTGTLELKLPPGVHKVSVSADGFLPKELEVNVQPGGTALERIELEAAPQAEPPPPPPPPPAAPPPPPPAPEKPRSKVPAYVTLGLAAVGAGVGTVFGVMALGKKSDFEDNPTTKNADDTERNALIADMSFGVAVTLGVTGIVLLTSKDAPEATAKLQKLNKLPNNRASLRVAPYVGPTGGGAAARLTF